MKKIILLIVFFTTLLINAQYTSIPDMIFEQALVNQGIDSDGIINGQVLTSDIVDVSDLVLQGLGINSLVGIEDFSSLERLNCKLNNLAELDLSFNLNLKELICGSNPLNEINLNNNVLLEKLNISVTNIVNINLENNTELIEFQCSVNHLLESINLTNTVSLEFLDLGDNWSLSSVDLSNCINLETLVYDNTFSSGTTLNLVNNTQLKHLFITGFPFSSINLDNNVLLETLSCPNNGLTSLDLSNNTLLEYLDCGDHNFDFGNFNHLTNLDLSNNINLEKVICNNVGLEDLNINNCINLKELHSYLNPINNLNVSNNIHLTKLNCSNNNISTINLTNNIELEYLSIGNNLGVWGGELPYKNNFTELDLDENVNLLSVNLSRNEFIENLYLQNEINENHSLNTLECYSLHCIYVDDVLSIPVNWYVESVSNYVISELECNSLSISDFNIINSVVIYPNPANNYFNINSLGVASDVDIYSILGERIKHFGSNYNQYDIRNLKRGMYIVRIKIGKKTIERQLIIS